MRRKFSNVSAVNIVDLQLDTRNPRLGELATQAECIEIMLEVKGPQVVEAAKDIGRRGLSPQDIVIYPLDVDQEGWVVKDGNRRITALKLLNNPELAPDKYRTQFRRIKDHTNLENVIQQVDCITSDIDTINDYMDLIHGGQLGGAGHVPWGSLEKDNHRDLIGKKRQNALASEVINTLVENGVKEAKQAKITNIDRFISDPDIQDRLEISFEDNELVFKGDRIRSLALLKEFILDFATRGKKVADIYDKQKRSEYLTELETNLPNDTNTQKTTKPSQGANPSEPSTKKPNEGKPNGTPVPPRAPRDRKRLIPPRQGLGIPRNLAKIITIQHELAKTINVREAPLAAALLFRALIEFSASNYIDKHGLSFLNDKRLHVRLEGIANSLVEQDHLSKKDAQIIKKMSNSSELLSTHTLNSCAHDKNYMPTSSDLCTLWDNMYHFLLLCWK